MARDAPAAFALSRATSAIPIVVVSGGSSVVTNLAHPEGNITGLSPIAPDLAAKWAQLLHEAVPTISRLATVSDHSWATAGRYRDAVERATLILQLQPPSHYDVRDLNHLSGVLSTVKAEGTDGLVVLSGGGLGGGGDPRIGGQILSVGIPAIADQRAFAAAGGLLAYGPIQNWGVQRSATYVDKLLKGAKPSDLPVEQPTTFDFVINLKTALALGLTIPQSILQQATEVIR